MHNDEILPTIFKSTSLFGIEKRVSYISFLFAFFAHDPPLQIESIVSDRRDILYNRSGDPPNFASRSLQCIGKVLEVAFDVCVPLFHQTAPSLTVDTTGYYLNI